MPLNYDHWVTERARAIDASGVRRVFDLAGKIKDPVNLSIGQPDFDVPDVVKQAAITAIQEGHNQYTVTQGARPVCEKIRGNIQQEFPNWAKLDAGHDFSTLVTSGVSGGLLLALLACVQPGDEVLIPDPYFVMYRHLVTLAGGKPVYVDTYPDFRLTAERVEPLITERTKLLIFSTPSNPTGAVIDRAQCKAIAELATSREILLLSDEIYDEFCYAKVERPDGSGRQRCPSPAEFTRDVLMLRGFSKTYGMTGWRMGYAVGPAPLIEQMTKLQQYTFVCAPSMAQVAAITALDTDMTEMVDGYQRRRDHVVQRLAGRFTVVEPQGAFYAFIEVPERLGLTATEFVEKAIEKKLLIIPGSVFSNRDTHFRISYACDWNTLGRGLDILLSLTE